MTGADVANGPPRRAVVHQSWRPEWLRRGVAVRNARYGE
jgi:hypothetical protein